MCRHRASLPFGAIAILMKLLGPPPVRGLSYPSSIRFTSRTISACRSDSCRAFLGTLDKEEATELTKRFLKVAGAGESEIRQFAPTGVQA
jgi:hypothetical protein